MKTYTFEQTVYYGDNYNRTLNLPDNIVFCEYTRYSEKQRFYFSVIKNASDEMESVFKSNFRDVIHIGNLLIGILSNVKPLCNIPEITIDEINEQFVSELRKMYIVSECENSDYMFLQRDLMHMCLKENSEELKGCLETPEAIEIMEKLKTMNPKYIEAIIRPIKFVKNGSCDHGPSLLCDCVQFKSWLRSDQNVDTFTKTNLDSMNLFGFDSFGHNKHIAYMGTDAAPWKEMFENRINEITKSAFE